MSGERCQCGHTEAEHIGPYDDCEARCLCDKCSPGTRNGCWCGGFRPGPPVDFLRPDTIHNPEES